MNPVEIGRTSFQCPKCAAPSLSVASRGGNPLAYHCSQCKEKFTASWQLLGDDAPDQLLEQAIDSDGNKHDLGKVDVAK